MAKLKPGDTFRIKTAKGYGFLQFVELDELGIEYARILAPISIDGNLSQAEVNLVERFCINFPLAEAKRKNIIEQIGYFDIPETFKTPEFSRSRDISPGKELEGWYIINRRTLKREYKEALSEEDLKLSPNGIINDILLIERLEEDWSLENWK